MTEDLSVSEVNAHLLAKGFDPKAIRRFAWELVQQELREPLSSYPGNREHQGPKYDDLKVRLWRLVEPLVAAGAGTEAIRRAIGELADEIKKRNE